MQFRAVVFDWDGTLFDSMSYKRENFILLFMPFGIERSLLYDYHVHASGIPRKDLFNQCLQKFKGQIFSEYEYSQISQRYSTLNIAASQQAKCFSEVKTVLEELKSKSVQLFVSSSSAHDELIQVVASSGIGQYFTDVLGSQDDLKKGPGHINYICQKYGLKQNEICFVGDDEQDLELGKQAGVFSLRIVRHSQGSSNLFAQRLDQLLRDNLLSGSAQ